MSTVSKFEDLIAWQKARALARDTYVLSRQPRFAHDFVLVNQLRRAALSVPANIAEGFERGGRSEFHQFLSIAKGSCAELRSHLYVAADVGYVDDAAFADLLGRAEEVARIVGRLRSAVGRQRPIRRKPTQSSVLSPQSS